LHKKGHRQTVSVYRVLIFPSKGIQSSINSYLFWVFSKVDQTCAEILFDCSYSQQSYSVSRHSQLS